MLLTSDKDWMVLHMAALLSLRKCHQLQSGWKQEQQGELENKFQMSYITVIFALIYQESGFLLETFLDTLTKTNHAPYIGLWEGAKH